MSDDDKKWGLVYNAPNQGDRLLKNRYAREDSAVRIARSVAKLYISTLEVWKPSNLSIHTSPFGVVSVASVETGRVHFTLRPVIAEAYLKGGHATADDDLEALVNGLLDSDGWE